MSPEQVRGKPVDKRADIWAFGVVLFELLTGRQLFGGETISDILAAVLTTDPELSRAPAKARRLLGLCLEKDPKRRLRDIADAKLLLDANLLLNETPPVPAPKSRLPWIIAAASAAVAAASFWLAWNARRSAEPASQPLIRLDVDLGSG